MGGCRSEGNRKEWREEIGREGEGGRERGRGRMGGCRSEGNGKEWREEIGRGGGREEEDCVCRHAKCIAGAVCVVTLTRHPLREYVGLDQFSHS